MMWQRMRAELAQLEAAMRDPALRRRYAAALAGGRVVAGFGSELNGVQVPETLLSGTLPPGVAAAEALEQVLVVMRAAVAQAERAQAAGAAHVPQAPLPPLPAEGRGLPPRRIPAR